MGNTITITVDATTDDAAQKLSKLGTTGQEALRQLREGSMLTREGFHGLSSAVMLLGGTHFPMLGEAVMGVRSAMMGTRTLSLLTGTSLATLIPVVGGVAAAVGAGALIWGSYRSEQQRVIEQQNKLTQAYKDMPELIAQINDAAKGGILSPETQNRLLQNIGAVKAAFTSDDFKKALLAGSQQPGVVNAQFSGHMSTSSLGIPDPEEVKRVREEFAKLGILKKETDPKDPTKVTYTFNPEIEALDKIAELRKKITTDSLIGYDKERAAAKQKYDDELQQLNEYIEVADPKLDAAKAGGLRTDLAGNYQSQLYAINKKQSDEAAKQQAEGAAKIREQFARDVTEQEKDLEQQITLNELKEGEKRGQSFEHEYQQRIFLTQQLYYAGELDEKAYTDLVVQASIKRLEAQKQYNNALRQEAMLKQEIARAELEGKLTAIRGNPFLSDQEKAKQSIPVEQKLISENNNRISELQVIAGQTNDASASLEAQKQITELMSQQAQLQNQLLNDQAAGTFWGTYKLNLAQLQSQWGSLSVSLANGAFATIRQGISGIANALTSVIMRTQSAGQAFAQFATQMLTSFISMIIESILWAKLAIPILTYLGVVSGGTTTATGSAVTIASIGAAMSVAAGVMGFSDGGLIRGPGTSTSDSIPAFLSDGEFVVNADAVDQIGPGTLQAINQGAYRSQPAAAAAESKSLPTKVVNVFDRQGLQEEIKKPDYGDIIVNHVIANKTRIGITT